MVISSMQGIDPDIKPRDTVLNGEILYGKEEEKILLFLAKIIGTKSLKNNNKINRLNSKYRYIYLKHPIKDKWNRQRITLIFWEHNTVTEDEIEKTIEVAGINKLEYIKVRENSKKKFFIF